MQQPVMAVSVQRLLNLISYLKSESDCASLVRLLTDTWLAQSGGCTR